MVTKNDSVFWRIPTRKSQYGVRMWNSFADFILPGFTGTSFVGLAPVYVYRAGVRNLGRGWHGTINLSFQRHSNYTTKTSFSETKTLTGFLRDGAGGQPRTVDFNLSRPASAGCVGPRPHGGIEGTCGR